MGKLRGLIDISTGVELDDANSLTLSSFETVNSNIVSSNATYNYTSGVLTSVAYADGITKTLNYTSGNLTSIVLSGATPDGIDLTKTYTYTSGNITGIVYS